MLRSFFPLCFDELAGERLQPHSRIKGPFLSMSPYFSYLCVLLQAHFHLHCYNLSTSRCLNGINLCGTTMEIAETRLFQGANTIVVVCCMFVMYVCMLYLHMCAHVCTRLWNAELSLGCHFLLLSILFFETWCHTKLGAHQYG